MDGFEKEYIKNKLGKKKGKTLSKQPEKVFEDFAKRIGEIITNKEPIAAKIIREQSNKTLNKTNYLMGFQNDKKTVSKQNQANIVKPTFPAFQKGFVSHGAIDYDFAIMESKLEQENDHHENHGHDGHGGDDGSAGRKEGPSTPPVPGFLPAQIVVSGVVGNDGTYVKVAPGTYIGNAGGSSYNAGIGVIYNRIQTPPPNYNPNFILGPYATIVNAFGAFITNGPVWQAYLIYFEDGEQYSVLSTNTSTNANSIPTTGWTPAITITAA